MPVTVTSPRESALPDPEAMVVEPSIKLQLKACPEVAVKVCVLLGVMSTVAKDCGEPGMSHMSISK